MEKLTFSPTGPRQSGFSSGIFLPGRLDAKQAAQVLGVQEHDVPVLVSRKLLDPLGDPVDNAKKYFAAVEIMEKAADPGWLAKATRNLYRHWQEKNASRKSNGTNTESSHAE
jgi:hypothetical protein